MTGHKVIDACNEKAKKLQLRYEELKREKDDLKNRITLIEKEICNLRKEEVNNVCDYVRTYTRIGVLNTKDIDIYLCHCQNMLNGNIDGTYLTFHKEKEED